MNSAAAWALLNLVKKDRSYFPGASGKDTVTAANPSYRNCPHGLSEWLGLTIRSDSNNEVERRFTVGF